MKSGREAVGRQLFWAAGPCELGEDGHELFSHVDRLRVLGVLGNEV
jgi:hypothetical protein